MREYTVKTKKAGDCIAIILPKELLAAERIGADMLVKITIQKCQNQSLHKSEEECAIGPEDPWRLLE